MRSKILHDSGARVTLTNREAMLVRTRRVPMMYSPGGMGPDTPADGCNVVAFGGACFVDARRKLVAALAAFKAALDGVA